MKTPFFSHCSPPVGSSSPSVGEFLAPPLTGVVYSGHFSSVELTNIKRVKFTETVVAQRDKANKSVFITSGLQVKGLQREGDYKREVFTFSKI